MSTALAIVAPVHNPAPASLAFEPADINQGVQLAKLLVASRLLPKAISTAEAAFTVIMTGRELGLTAMQSIRSIHVIDGKPSMSADLMVALAKRSPVCAYLRIVETTAERAVYETRRHGETEPTRIGFSIEDAQKAGLLSRGPWKQYPAAMLRARAAAAICRAVYPDLLLGVYETDELAAGGIAPDVEPVRHVKQMPAGGYRAEDDHDDALERLDDAHVETATPDQLDKPIPFSRVAALVAAYDICSTVDEVNATRAQVEREHAADAFSRESGNDLRAAREAALRRIESAPREPGED